MSSTSDELAYERVINRKYLQYINAKPVYPIYGVVRKHPRTWGPLTGRVSFLQSAPEDDAEFYIGPQQAMWKGVEVVSWAAPAAQAFFTSDRRWNGQYIRVRRRFNCKQDSILGYTDEWVMRKDKTPFPAPDRRRTLVRPNGKVVDRETTRPDPADRVPPTTTELQAARLAESEQDNSTRQQYLRAAMEAPRLGRLGSVLSTLQPEQYDLVTSDPGMSLTVQGFAGTGKSIIATHRAAWLTHPDREGPEIGNLLLLGPTRPWADHVGEGVKELAVNLGRVKTRTLGQLITELLGLPSDHRDVATPWDLGPVITRFATQCINGVRTDPRSRKDARTVYVALRTRRQPLKRDASQAIQRQTARLEKWQAELPHTYEEALLYDRYHPLLAYVSACLQRPSGFGHVIVDEAQDLRHLEWKLLSKFNRGTWTLLGDISQCRSEDGITDWTRVPAILDKDPWPISNLTAGFRSTQNIIDFASAILPSSAARRSTSILGAGQSPRLVNVKEARHTMEVIALKEAQRLAARHLRGTVALISTDAVSITRVALRRSWTRTEATTWRSPTGNLVHILEADECRGLEFDATVVVEPAAFRLRGRSFGHLYTALTRANRELVVVHEKPLPAALAQAAEVPGK